jgi:viroplasmin and RNaseH domain-containing protein
MPKKKKYYAYVVPHGPAGVTDNWNECERLVSGRAGARYKAFEDIYTAERWLALGAQYEPKQAPKRQRLAPGIYFDAGTGRGKGVEVSVTDEKGEDLLRRVFPKKKLNRFGKHLIPRLLATNNYGELLAFKYALQIAEKEGVKQIFGDSKLVIDYWSRWQIKRNELPAGTVRLADEVAALREKFEEGGGTIQRIPGAQNPADLGFH